MLDLLFLLHICIIYSTSTFIPSPTILQYISCNTALHWWVRFMEIVGEKEKKIELGSGATLK